ncbi:hypothetical protein ACMA5I_11735 [Paracoccaceae bacterium GXU_MW_L88]
MADIRNKNAIWGPTIIAVIVFFILNFGAGIVLEDQVVWRAGLSAIIKTAIFGAIFHWIHNFIANLFGWYEPILTGPSVEEIMAEDQKKG